MTLTINSTSDMRFMILSIRNCSSAINVRVQGISIPPCGRSQECRLLPLPMKREQSAEVHVQQQNHSWKLQLRMDHGCWWSLVHSPRCRLYWYLYKHDIHVPMISTYHGRQLVHRHLAVPLTYHVVHTYVINFMRRTKFKNCGPSAESAKF